MQIFLSLLFFGLSFHVQSSCDFRPSVKEVISLSGSTTVVLNELGLLNHPKLKGISVFNPISEKEFKGTVYPGGIFLSQKTLPEFDGSVIFFDESRDLRRILTSRNKINAIEIKTRNHTPLETIQTSLDVINEFVTGCEEKAQLLKKHALTMQEKILKLIPSGLSVVFYLGDTTGERLPEMVMVKDGAVKWLRDEKKIRTYPSDLSYVNWSSKILQELPKGTLHVGIKDSGRTGLKEIKKSSDKMTFIYPGALVPGSSQLRAFLFWAEGL